jgi:hypothetical protein
MVTPKTDGLRFLLLLTVTPEDGRPVALMIGRDMQMYEVQVWGTESLFLEGTLLDGELAWCAGVDARMKYFAFDAIAIAGKRVGTQPLPNRLLALRNLLELSPTHRQWLSRYASDTDESLLQFIVEENKVVCTPNNLFDLSFTPKHMVSAASWGGVRGGVQWGETADARNFDGLIFTPKNKPVYIGTHRELFKWKPPVHCTVDVEVRDGRALARGEDGTATHLAMLEGLPVRLMVSDTGSSLDDGVYECHMKHTDAEIQLHPARQRTDKNRANTEQTVRSVFGCLQDDISEDELMTWFGPPSAS